MLPIVRRSFVPVALAALAACGAAPPPPPAPEPEPVAEAPPPPQSEPDFTLEERLRQPFAVRAQGRTAPRLARSVVVVEAPPAAEPRAEPAAGNSAPTAAPAAGTRPAAPAAAAPRPTTPPAAPARAPTTHDVGAGETFLAIARRYGVTYTQLLNANPGVDPDRIRPGQTLRLPAGAAASRPAAAPARQPAAAAARRTHTVVRGETLFGISRRYGVEPARIRAANQLQGDTVRIGQTLVIPDPR